MSTIKINKPKSGFTMVSNHALQNPSISLKAKGLFALLLSFPDGWEMSVKGLNGFYFGGREQLQSGLKELEQNGYLLREFKNTPSIHYSWSLEYFPRTGFPFTEKPSTNKDFKIKTKEISTSSVNNSHERKTQPAAEAEFLDFVKKVRQDKAGSLLFEAKEGFQVGITSDGMLYNATSGKTLSAGKAKDLWARYYQHHKELAS